MYVKLLVLDECGTQYNSSPDTSFRRMWDQK